MNQAVALIVLALAVAASASFSPNYEEACCPGPVVEQKALVTKAINLPYTYSVPTNFRQCYQRRSVDRSVTPLASEKVSCQTEETETKVPSTDVVITEQPLCNTTCTTREYIIQIPITETTCTSSPLCSRTVSTQDKAVTTVTRKHDCVKNVCTQNRITEIPLSQVVCQNYQGSVTKTGSRTVLKPEVIKKCVQLPPYKCLKPAVYGSDSSAAYGAGIYGAGSYGQGYSGAVAYGQGYSGDFAYGSGNAGAECYGHGNTGAISFGHGKTGSVSYGSVNGCFNPVPAPAPIPTPAPNCC